MSRTMIIDSDILAAIRSLDPERMLNPPKANTPEWDALTNEERLRLVGRLMREIHVHESEAARIREAFSISEVWPPILGGVRLVTNAIMPRDMVAFMDQQGNVLAISRLSSDEGARDG